MPIVILGSYILAKSCKKNKVSSDGRTNFCFNSNNLWEFLFDGVEFVIGNPVFTFNFFASSMLQTK